MRVVLLIARYREDLTWVEDVPDELEVVVVNKGEDLPDIPRDNLTVFRSDNVGREAETYINYIVQNYEDLPDRIIFSQGNPFEHSPFFLELIQDFRAWQGFQPMTLQFKDYLPPRQVRIDYRKVALDNRIWVDRADGCTMNTVFYDDPDFDFFAKRYRAINGLTHRDNLVRHFLSSNGFEISAENHLEEVNFSFGAIFSVDSEMMKRHGRIAYTRLLGKFEDDETLPYIAERCWMALFDDVSAVQESQWSLPLSERGKRHLTVAPSSGIHPSRDFVITKKSPPKSRGSFVANKTEPTPLVPHSNPRILTFVTSQKRNPEIVDTVTCPTRPLDSGPDLTTPEVHPDRDFVIAKPPTRHRYKV